MPRVLWLPVDGHISRQGQSPPSLGHTLSRWEVSWPFNFGAQLNCVVTLSAFLDC